jgi:hypothetical protein
MFTISKAGAGLPHSKWAKRQAASSLHKIFLVFPKKTNLPTWHSERRVNPLEFGSHSNRLTPPCHKEAQPCSHRKMVAICRIAGVLARARANGAFFRTYFQFGTALYRTFSNRAFTWMKNTAKAAFKKSDTISRPEA